ncbi:hypothetical protein LTR50_001615 [Elasticomyces elasticus]|nr:hypothetical protein LTR50_001615 [Elasticomyces elasticus]
MSRPSNSSDDSLRPKPLNFSRPRPRASSSSNPRANGTPDYPAPRRAPPPLPEQANRHSLDSNISASTHATNSTFSSIADLGWDGRLGWQVPKRSDSNYDTTRYAPSRDNSDRLTPLVPSSSNDTSGSSSSSSQGESQDSGASLMSSERPPEVPFRLPRIVKRMSIDQMSEHLDPRRGSTFSGGSDPEFRPSDHDTSGLSIAQIHKLQKKGINPALYAEMKAARKGKGKWVGPLVGNTYLG